MSCSHPRLCHAASRGDLIRRSPVAQHRGGHVHGTCDPVRPLFGRCVVRTLAIRLEDELHATLGMIAKVEGLTLTDAMHQAIDQWIDQRRHNPELQARAQAMLEEIEQDAATRRGAIQALLGTGGSTAGAKPTTRRGRSTGKGEEESPSDS